MKQFFSIAFLLSLAWALRAQDTLSGIINRYAAVQGINYCNNSLTLSSTAGFSVGQAVLIIQMQGAAINTSNTAAYGNITSFGSAGLYERGYINSIDGSQLRLEKALLNEYDLAGAVQVVSMPAYEQAIVAGMLTAQAWDGTTGGVLAFSAGQLSLQGDIDVSGKGFRGGSAALNYTGDCTFLSSFSNYAYEESSIRGGKKGEGISAIAANLSRGRGAAANGGGGGNDHNAGGGGGANLSSGGNGGQNDNPTFFGCRGLFPGIGGKAQSASPERLFLGGGGGAGHGNNNTATSGGKGGGIILIEAVVTTGFGGSIRANGLDAETSAGDGAGGGGGGGTIAINGIAPNLPGIVVEARGGRGGDVNNLNSSQCLGPGGGGAGGRLMLAPGFMAAVGLVGGQPGMALNSTQCSPSTNGAQAGMAGLQQAFASIPEGDEINQPPTLQVMADSLSACVGGALQLMVLAQGFELSFQWQVDMGNGFIDIIADETYSQVDSPFLQINQVSTAMGSFTYRLVLTTDCFPPIFSSPIFIQPIPVPSASFSFMVAGLSAQFTNASSNADTFFWDFGDGASSVAATPSHNYTAAGFYEVLLIAENDCGMDTLIQQLFVGQPPVLAFSATSPTTGCAPFSVSFANQSTGSYDSLLWLFPGGTPASSTADNPTVSYAAPGQYGVELRLFSPFGDESFFNPQAVSVLSRPEPDFDFSIDGLTASFFNTTPAAESYVWNFGDGNTSTLANPVHTYAAPGTYSVTLNASNGPCAKAISQTIVISATQAVEISLPEGVSLFPNPFSSHLSLRTERLDWYPVRWKLLAADGRMLQEGTASADRDWALEWLPSGIYWLIFSNGRASWVGKAVKR
jgi:PKD repeat protein